jgi:predicted adenylyl cyclase CyaB
MALYEIEIKSLLGDQVAADLFRSRLLRMQPILTETSSQLNHYFTGGSLDRLYDEVAQVLSAQADRQRLDDIRKQASTYSVRTRKLNDTVLLIVKAAIDDTTSANGIARMEFETPVEGLSLEALDQMVLSAGFEYEAKWSRYREQYQLDDITVCLDKNAGYGYLAEFELLITDPNEAPNAKDRIGTLMTKLDASELSQERLGRMFDHYNHHWQDYYGTEKTFVVE